MRNTSTRLAAAALFSLISLTALAQYEIRGTVTDKQENNIIEYASVAVYSLPDTAFVKGVTTDLTGKFRLADVPEQNLIRVSMLGYKPLWTRATASGDMGQLGLEPDAQMLAEVTVRGKMLDFGARGMTATIQNTPLAKAGMMKDVLRQLPFLSVVGDKVEVFDKGEPIYYINNRRVRDLDELRSIQSASIKKIEVITDPGAEYKGGTGAVIRITLVRKAGDGLGGNVMAYGFFTRKFNHIEKAQLNYRRGDLDIFGSMAYMDYRTRAWLSDDYSHGDGRGFSQWAESLSKSYILTPSLGINYVLRGRHFLGAEYRGQYSPQQHICDGLIKVTSHAGDDTSEDFASDMRSTRHTASAYYRWEIGKRSSLQVDLDMYSVNSTGVDTRLATKTRPVASRETLVTTEDDNSSFYAGKAVWAFPLLASDVKLGTELTHTKNDYRQIITGDKQLEYMPTPNVSLQNNYAAFLDYSVRLGRILLGAGLRLEHTNFNYYLDGKLSNEVSQRYTDLFPNVSVGYRHKDMSANVAYSRSIVRPSYSELTSSMSYQYDYLYAVGNPKLQNAVIDLVSYRASWKSFQLMGNYRHISNRAVGTLLHLEGSDDILLKTSESIGSYNSLSLGLSYMAQVAKSWATSLEYNFSKPWLRYHGVSYNKPLHVARWKNQLQLPWGLTAFTTLVYNTRSQANLTTKHQEFRVDLGLSKSLAKDRLEINLNVADLLNTHSSVSAEWIGDITHHSNTSNMARSLSLSVSYRFNSTRSKYRGAGAGTSERQRLEK